MPNLKYTSGGRTESKCFGSGNWRARCDEENDAPREGEGLLRPSGGVPRLEGQPEILVRKVNEIWCLKG